MVREDILGGLRNALARGQPLKQAMMSFYNAGYLKEEIEEAARALHLERTQPQTFQPQFPSSPNQVAPIFQRTSSVKQGVREKPKEVLSQTAKPVQPVQPQPVQPQPIQPQTVQKVSAYGPPAQPVQPIQPQTVQKVSAYGPPAQPTQQQIQPPLIQQIQRKPIQKPLEQKPKGKGVIFILLALLIILIGGLIAVFFFKEEILAFFETI